MKSKTWYSLIVIITIFTMICCHSGNSSRNGTLSETERLERFLDIPVYPGAEMVMLFTDDRDDHIPQETKPATVSLAVDHRDSVPVFYERELGYQFKTDTSRGKMYYKLVFNKKGWEYEIMVGQDRYKNKPMFTISIMESFNK